VAGACPSGSTQGGTHGSCNTATTACTCTDGFRGNDCSVPADTTCTSTTCKNGACSSGTCQCNDGWAGTNCDKQAADSATVTIYSGSTCAANTQTSTFDVSLDSCTKFPDNVRSGTVLCPNGVNGAFTLQTYSASTTCTGTADALEQGTDNTDCKALAGTGAGFVTVQCKVSGAVAVQASLLLVAMLAFISKYMQ